MSQYFLSLFILFFFSFYVSSSIVLQPIAAVDIGNVVSEPSGLSFCNITGHLYSICDQGKCHYIYELDSHANLIQAWKFSKDYSNDIEACACDSINRKLYIAEEGLHRITSFPLPVGNSGWHADGSDKRIDPIESFIISTGYHNDESGIEGLTVDTTRNLLYAVNEKDPKIFFALFPNGTVLYTSYPDFSGDLSGLCYDESLDKIWVVSDQSDRIYLIELDGVTVVDYWDLPIENAEGVAVDNTKNPSILYITTDPSDPSGVGYVAALFTFVKPTPGEGLAFFSSITQELVSCDGCDAVWAEVDLIFSAYYSELQAEKQLIYTSLIVGMGFCFIIFACCCCCFYCCTKLRKLYRGKDYGHADELPTAPAWITEYNYEDLEEF